MSRGRTVEGVALMLFGSVVIGGIAVAAMVVFLPRVPAPLGNATVVRPLSCDSTGPDQVCAVIVTLDEEERYATTRRIEGRIRPGERVDCGPDECFPVRLVAQ